MRIQLSPNGSFFHDQQNGLVVHVGETVEFDGEITPLTQSWIKGGGLVVLAEEKPAKAPKPPKNTPPPASTTQVAEAPAAAESTDTGAGDATLTDDEAGAENANQSQEGTDTEPSLDDLLKDDSTETKTAPKPKAKGKGKNAAK